MSLIPALLQSTAHRPYPLPSGPWAYYQEWNETLFLHYKVPADAVAALIPKGLTIDTINGQAWVSVVAFTMDKIRPRQLPAVKAISSFYEINVRTYVMKDDKPGVYFLNIEGQKLLSVLMAKGLSGMPYENARMHRKKENDLHHYHSQNKKKDFSSKPSMLPARRITIPLNWING